MRGGVETVLWKVNENNGNMTRNYSGKMMASCYNVHLLVVNWRTQLIFLLTDWWKISTKIVRASAVTWDWLFALAPFNWQINPTRGIIFSLIWKRALTEWTRCTSRRSCASVILWLVVDGVIFPLFFCGRASLPQHGCVVAIGFPTSQVHPQIPCPSTILRTWCPLSPSLYQNRHGPR